jgi:ring-1,2-phenylacetyl-CoA epoxidase subunit PaaE
MTFYQLKISNIQLETKDTISVYFDIPNNLKNKFEFDAGQYLTIKEMIFGNEIRRAYSISTSPKEEKIGITIKRVAGGKLSTFIHSNWKKGMEVEVASPEGNFILKPDHDKKRNLYFIAAGSGITPILSMIKTIVVEEPMSICHLLYGSRSEDNIIFKDSLEELENKYSGQLFIKHTLSSPLKEKEKGLSGLFKKSKISWKGETGRISKEKIENFLDLKNNALNENHYFLCGPGDLIITATKVLENRGVSEEYINREYFNTPIPSENVNTINGISSSVKVHLNGDIIEFQTDGKKAILDELINLKKNPPYSCTSGACSSCMAKVINGKVDMEVCFALDEADLANGLILTCQARPTTDILEISYDV